MAEQLVLMSALWLPAYCVRVSVTQPEMKPPRIGRLRSTVVHRSTSVDNLYEALTGTHLGAVGHPWQQVQMDPRIAMPPTYRDTKVHADIRKAFASYDRVSSDSAVARHAATLNSLGVPTPCSSVSIDSTALVYLPYVVGILEAQGRQRVVAIEGHTGAGSGATSRALTSNLPQIREQIVASPTGR
jgi:hypothetical protein